MKKTLIGLVAIVGLFGFVLLPQDASADRIVEDKVNDAVELKKVKDPNGDPYPCNDTLNNCWRDCNAAHGCGPSESGSDCCTKHSNGKVYKPKKRRAKKDKKRPPN